MNHLSVWADRCSETQGLIDYELKQLRKEYNPITKEIPVDTSYEIDPDTPPFAALEAAYPKIKCAGHTTDCIASMLNCSKSSAKKVGVHNLPVNQIWRRHMVRLLEQCSKDPDLSASSYNHYRSYLRMMFRVLVKLEAIETNPITDEIEKEKSVCNLRTTLTPEEGAKVDSFLNLQKGSHAYLI